MIVWLGNSMAKPGSQREKTSRLRAHGRKKAAAIIPEAILLTSCSKIKKGPDTRPLFHFFMLPAGLADL
jgi:hypothetical protein